MKPSKIAKTIAGLILALATFSAAQNCVAGVRVQKTFELYWQNGLELECRHASLLSEHLSLGLSVVSSRLGSAYGSNALKQEEYLFNTAWYFRTGKYVQPYAGLSAGWFWLDVENPAFSVIPHSAPLLALQGGCRWNFGSRFSLQTGLGYHLLTGDGLSGPGSLYPLFMRLSLGVRVCPW